MKQSTAVANLIRRNHAVKATPTLLVEWNHNRYSGPKAFNTPAEDEDGDETEFFPIESIIEGRRPLRGIVKARVNEAVVGDVKYQEKSQNVPHYYTASEDDTYKYWTSPKATSTTGVMPAYAGAGGRNTVCNPRVEYSKSCSTNKIVLTLENSTLVDAKRREPLSYEVWTRPTTTGAWTLAATNPAIDSKGQIVLYANRDPNDSSKVIWNTSRTLANVTPVAGIELRVKTMKNIGVAQHFDLIEISARLEQDLTEYMTTVEDTFDMGETDFLKPLGRASSNVATVTLFNSYTDGSGYMFNNNNPNSPFYGLLDANVKFTLDYTYSNPDTGAVAGTVRQFTMYSEGAWNGGSSESVSVSLRDSSKYLQEETPRSLYYRDQTLASIVWRLMDSVGFNNYVTQIQDDSSETIVPHFWTTGEQTVWEIISELAEGTQTGIWFDAYDNLQIATRDYVFSATATPVWTFRGQKSGDEVTDIADWDQEDQYEANTIKVSYQTTEFEPDVNGFPVTESVWEPEDETVLIRGADLIKPLGVSDTFFYLVPREAATWPYASVVQIEGEFIRYEGKWFNYYVPTVNSGGVVTGATRKGAWVYSQEQYLELNKLAGPGYQHLNAFSGGFRIIKRGEWNTTAKAHVIDANGYWTRTVIGDRRVTDVSGFIHKQRVAQQEKYIAAQKEAAKKKAAAKKAALKKKGIVEKTAYFPGSAPKVQRLVFPKTTGVTGLKQISTDSRAVLETKSYYNDYMWLISTVGDQDDDTLWYYGTRMRFEPEGQKSQSGGICINTNGSADEGYYIELKGTSFINPATRALRNEVLLYSRKKDANGNMVTRYLGGEYKTVQNPQSAKQKKKQAKPTYKNVYRGARASISQAVWYDLDVAVKQTTGNKHQVSVMVNGVQYVTFQIEDGFGKAPLGGRFGIFARGHSKISFEYLYGQRRPEAPDVDQATFFDRVRGGYVGNQLTKEWVYQMVTRVNTRLSTKKRKVKEVVKANQLFFDEFGPIVHEVREYDVKFENGPVIGHQLYNSNEENQGRVLTPEYYGDPFHAKFILANASRGPAVVKGDDISIGGVDNPVNQKLFIYGQLLKQREAQTVTASDDAAVRARGKIESVVESKWIQTKGAAEKLAAWIKKHWSGSSDSATLTTFGNTLIEVGDVVYVDYDEVSVKPATHRWVVVSARSDFDQGLSTTFTLRRIKV